MSFSAHGFARHRILGPCSPRPPRRGPTGCPTGSRASDRAGALARLGARSAGRNAARHPRREDLVRVGARPLGGAPVRPLAAGDDRRPAEGRDGWIDENAPGVTVSATQVEIVIRLAARTLELRRDGHVVASSPSASARPDPRRRPGALRSRTSSRVRPTAPSTAAASSPSPPARRSSQLVGPAATGSRSTARTCRRRSAARSRPAAFMPRDDDLRYLMRTRPARDACLDRLRRRLCEISRGNGRAFSRAVRRRRRSRSGVSAFETTEIDGLRPASRFRAARAVAETAEQCCGDHDRRGDDPHEDAVSAMPAARPKPGACDGERQRRATRSSTLSVPTANAAQSAQRARCASSNAPSSSESSPSMPQRRPEACTRTQLST